MAKYRKKPVVVEALQWDGNNTRAIQMLTPRHIRLNGKQLAIPTLEGTMLADVGDYIIIGVKSEVYPCKPDIFLATYEYVSE